MSRIQRITPCLWFDSQAEEAATFYCGVFDNSRITRIARYTEAGHEYHHKPPGSVMTIEFELDGQLFVALNGGPLLRFNEAVSLTVNCETQEEVDHYWDTLSAGGDEAAQQCGWLKDRYGVSWQIVPTILPALMSDPDHAKARRATEAMLRMKKLDIDALRHAAEAQADAGVG